MREQTVTLTCVDSCRDSDFDISKINHYIHLWATSPNFAVVIMLDNESFKVFHSRKAQKSIRDFRLADRFKGEK